MQAEAAKGAQANEPSLSAACGTPDILEVTLATLAHPLAGFGLAAKKVVDKMKAEAEKKT